MEGILEVAVGIGRAEEFRGVGFVVAEQQVLRLFVMHGEAAERFVLDTDRAVAQRLQRRLLRILELVPRVAKPDLRQDGDLRRFGTAVGHRDPHQDVIDVRLGVFDVDVEVTVFIEDAGIEDLELGLEAAALESPRSRRRETPAAAPRPRSS